MSPPACGDAFSCYTGYTKVFAASMGKPSPRGMGLGSLEEDVEAALVARRLAQHLSADEVASKQRIEQSRRASVEAIEKRLSVKSDSVLSSKEAEPEPEPELDLEPEPDPDPGPDPEPELTSSPELASPEVVVSSPRSLEAP